jgi:hypothetical protein
MDPVLLELNTNNDDFMPFSGRAYPEPHIQYETTAKEINRLLKIGVLSECSTKDNSKKEDPTFSKTRDV